MDSNDTQLLARAMAGYERSRLKRALLAAFPSLLLPLVAFAVGGRLMISVLLGLLIWAATVALTWRGQSWGRSVPVGLVAGAFPLGLALMAQKIGHVCTAHGCTSLCVPMCAAGGLAAGVAIAAAARRSASPATTLGCGAALALAVGAMGCSCVGAAGMLGMGVALAASAAAAMTLQRLIARR